MIIIFDTFGGLCNQFYDIICGINFCIIHNISFTFRYCSFRNPNLNSWHDTPFDKLFDTSFLNKYNTLYINFDNLNIPLTHKNTYNLDGKLSVHLNINELNDIIKIQKKYIILKQFWPIHKFSNIVDNNIVSHILPSKRLIELYNKIKNDLLPNNEKYNFIHYRYEIDFTSHFNLSVDFLANVILNTTKKFKVPELKIYIATSNIKNIIDLNNIELNNFIITKDEDKLTDYNFEELAFIDFMFGLNSNEVYGHNKSSFSCMLNNIKCTNNYYN